MMPEGYFDPEFSGTEKSATFWGRNLSQLRDGYSPWSQFASTKTGSAQYHDVPPFKGFQRAEELSFNLAEAGLPQMCKWCKHWRLSTSATSGLRMQMLMKRWVKQGPQGLGGYCGHPPAKDSTWLARGINLLTNMFAKRSGARSSRVYAFQVITNLNNTNTNISSPCWWTVRNWDTALWFAAEWRQRGRSDLSHGCVAASASCKWVRVRRLEAAAVLQCPYYGGSCWVSCDSSEPYDLKMCQCRLNCIPHYVYRQQNDQPGEKSLRLQAGVVKNNRASGMPRTTYLLTKVSQWIGFWVHLHETMACIHSKYTDITIYVFIYGERERERGRAKLRERERYIYIHHIYIYIYIIYIQLVIYTYGIIWVWVCIVQMFP